MDPKNVTKAAKFAKELESLTIIVNFTLTSITITDQDDELYSFDIANSGLISTLKKAAEDRIKEITEELKIL